MAEPFLSEIRLMSFVFAPRGWALCNGQLLPINQNQALFSLLGTTYGGDGRVTFALPDLRGRVPAHVGDGLTLGQRGGQEAVTLTTANLPTHTHFVTAGGAADTADPAGARFAATAAFHYNTSPQVAMAPGAVGTTGGSQAHLNMAPSLVLSYAIALQGIFPSPN